MSPRNIATGPADNLFTLAARYLGDATLWERLAVLNAIGDPFRIPIGMIAVPVPNAVPALLQNSL